MNSLPSTKNKTREKYRNGSRLVVDSTNFTSGAEVDPALEIEKLKIKY